ncbi:DUF4315 family protein [Ruminococcaceae bacterium OttesenSCG-928-A16]|nr:DUF4315 family protein [Clostridia bacterium OttesenSCG-928-F22]MDL2324401.1 DUF4315 family protein [Ruminococcaceae bacterium OttesenSCG-928-A16]
MKAERIQTEIEKTKDKISTLQGRLRELERQKTETENTDIIAVVRSANISQQELLAFIDAFKTRGAAAETMLASPSTQEDYADDED